MANSFGFQFDEKTLRTALAKIEECKRLYPGGDYVLQYSVTITPDGAQGYDAHGITLLVLDAKLQEADSVTTEDVQPMTWQEYKQLI